MQNHIFTFVLKRNTNCKKKKDNDSSVPSRKPKPVHIFSTNAETIESVT